MWPAATFRVTTLPAPIKAQALREGDTTWRPTWKEAAVLSVRNTEGEPEVSEVQPVEAAGIDSRQIEAARIAMTRHIKRGGQVWIRIFPDKPVTAKPAETRMGSGKGAPDHWVAVVKPGTMLFELGGVQHDTARECFARVAHKLPVRVRLVGRTRTL